MVTESDTEFEQWPPAGAEPDPVRVAVGKLLAAVIEGTAEGSRERALAMTEVLEAHTRINAAMRVRPRLN